MRWLCVPSWSSLCEVPLDGSLGVLVPWAVRRVWGEMREFVNARMGREVRKFWSACGKRYSARRRFYEDKKSGGVRRAPVHPLAGSFPWSRAILLLQGHRHLAKHPRHCPPPKEGGATASGTDGSGGTDALAGADAMSPRAFTGNRVRWEVGIVS